MPSACLCPSTPSTATLRSLAPGGQSWDRPTFSPAVIVHRGTFIMLCRTQEQLGTSQPRIAASRSSPPSQPNRPDGVSPVRPTSFIGSMLTDTPIQMAPPGMFDFLASSNRAHRHPDLWRHRPPSTRETDDKLVYRTGLVVFDREDPTKLLCRASAPLFSLEKDWEKAAPVANVVLAEGPVSGWEIDTCST